MLHTEEHNNTGAHEPDNHSLLGLGKEVQIGLIAGTVNKGEEMRFNRMIFRATRGTALVHFQHLDHIFEDYYGNKSIKQVYVVIFQEGATMRNKIQRISDSFMGNRFDIPNGDFEKKIMELNKDITNIMGLIRTTRIEIRKFLNEINKLGDSDEVSVIAVYKIFIRMERIVYSNLNCLKSENSLHQGFIWS